MTVLFDHPSPFMLAHGGFQVQIEATKRALEQIGVKVEWLRWWDDSQVGDVIHFFGSAPVSYLLQAKGKGIPVVMTSLFSETCNRSELRLRLQGALVQSILRLPVGAGIKRQLTWSTFSLCTHNVVGSHAERNVLETVYKIDSERISEVPLGLDEAYFNLPSTPRGEGPLIYVGAINAQKNCVPLARLAHAAKTPILFVGKPHTEDLYWNEFRSLVDGTYVLHEPHVSDRQQLIALQRAARGFVLVSEFENWSLAAHEAAACGLPLLLRRQSWAVERFAGHACFFDAWGSFEAVEELRNFYDASLNLPAPRVALYSWRQVAELLRELYRDIV